MRTIKIKLKDNRYPLDDLFNQIVVFSKPSSPFGVIDLCKAKLIIDIGDLNPKATKVVMEALWLGVQWNWNLESGDVATGASVFLKLRVEKPKP